MITSNSFEVSRKRGLPAAFHITRFEIGYGKLGLVKYLTFLLAGAGLWTGLFGVVETMIVGFVYLIFCYIFGWWWFASKMFLWQIEVSNRNNLFVTEMRKVYKGKKS